MHDLIAWPLEITVQAPHWPRPQPNLGPRSSRSSLRTNSSGVAGSTSTVRARPFTRSVKAAMGVRIHLVPGPRTLKSALLRGCQAFFDLGKRAQDDVANDLQAAGAD